MKQKWMVLVCLTVVQIVSGQSSISEKASPGSFPLAGDIPATIVTDANDHWLVQKAASLLQADILAVSGKQPLISNTVKGSGKNIVLIGSLDRSGPIAELLRSGKLQADRIKGKWEGYQIQVLSKPMPGVDKALVIVGSDKRGTAYGVFDIAQQIGVSPWYWWADVPVKKKQAIYVGADLHKADAPAVKYRGIFINDEAPAFSGWTKEKFGGVNHTMYEKMFELILRLKGNYLWPAMWGNAFNDDDTLNPVMADKWGIVMGTSHHEPMLRAQQEWKRYGKGEWNYQKNDTILRNFWRKGIENMRSHESIVTVGMRGDGDMPMTQGSNIALLEKIVADQRQIIEDATKKPASETPQLWALYKEVQDYYDKGMRVPDDVTLLLCDDNWGNIRKLPKLSDAPRKGGYGIYYHFDYVGGPRNYKWINTNPIARVWEQMHLAYEYGVRNIWIVNVGDLKPMEFPISFWLDYAWAPDRIKATDLQKYTEQWAAAQFGKEHAAEIAVIISKYTKYNGRRKPELLDANTYNILNYREAERAAADYRAILAKAEGIRTQLPSEYQDSYFELVLHPVKASSNLLDMYRHVAWNRYYASVNSPRANAEADSVKQLYAKDSLISREYNAIAGGKWNHMMDQTHIGYTYWQQPNVQKMPELKYVAGAAEIDSYNNYQEKNAKNLIPKNHGLNVFFERDGYISIEADHYSNAVNTDGISWQVLPDHGRTGSAITIMPVTAPEQAPGKGPHLEYELYFSQGDSVKLQAYFSPTLNFHNDEGLKYAVSFDNESPQLVSINKDDNNQRLWNDWVANNIIIKNTRHFIPSAGKHVLKFWMVSPAVVLQKLVVDAGGVKQSYLGPPETK
ncbi:MAG: glycosyl hydrolase 115 family protein [Chitinophagaceae bacterium]|nr:glycosyl hydrolase 115 family protein [Chitinophagaceae bacterium]